MASLFNKDSEPKQPLSNLDKIESEVAHLKKKNSVRDQPGAKKVAPWIFTLIILGLIWLYVMDPFLHAYYKSQAIRSYLYIHSYGSGPLADQLIATHIFTEDEVAALNRKHGAYQDYYSSPEAANSTAQSVVDYMNGVYALHNDKYKELNKVGKLRYIMFIKSDIPTPTVWSSLDPTVSQD